MVAIRRPPPKGKFPPSSGPPTPTTGFPLSSSPHPISRVFGPSVITLITLLIAYEILREVRRSGTLVDNEKIEIECAPRVAEVLSKQERDYLDHLEKRFQKLIIVIGQKGWKPDQYRVAGSSPSTSAHSGVPTVSGRSVAAFSAEVNVVSSIGAVE